MPRADRLLDLLQLLRRHERPVPGHVLAAALGVSLRTLCRDIAILGAQGTPILGEPGQGYLLRSEALRAPLQFTGPELEALAVGARRVAEGTDPRLAAAARIALARLEAARPALATTRLDLGSPAPSSGIAEADVRAIRAAIRGRRKLAIRYREPRRGETQRMLWPLALGYHDRARVLLAHCETAGEVRAFRTDRITALAVTASRYPGDRRTLLQSWRDDAPGPRPQPAACRIAET